jgi:hypothetical protein
MDIVSGAAPAPEAPARSLETLVSDLALVLGNGRALYFSLESDGAVLTVKAPEVFAFGESFGARWARMGPRERAETVVDWIGRAATYYRNPRSIPSTLENVAI